MCDDLPESSELFCSDSWGVYIPKVFADSIRHELVSGVSDDEWRVLISGPEHADYWDVWLDVVAHATIKHPRLGECTLYPDGDLWLVPLCGPDCAICGDSE